MNDRYLYRAKRTDNGGWEIGSLIYLQDGEYEIANKCTNPPDSDPMWGKCVITHKVDPSTICQCTGMPDKNSKVAYEHDIIKTPVGNAKIIWSCSPSPTDNHINVGFEIVFLDATANDNYRHDLGYWIGKSEVIGNIFDNPELLEV